MSDPPAPLPEVGQRGLLAAAMRLVQRRGAARAGNERALLGLAAAVFVIASVIGLRNFPEVEGELRWWVLAALPAVGVPLTVASNAWEFAVTARLLRLRVAPLAATRVAVLSTAANLLPIPGAVLVRTRALRGLGASLGRAFMATTFVGIARIGVVGALAGALQLAVGDRGLGIVVTAGGLAFTAACMGLARRDSVADTSTPVLCRVLAVEATLVAVSALRLWFVLHGLGIDASPTQAVALSVAGVLASAIGFFPGGLGVRELLAAGIGPLVGLPAALSLVTTALDRVVGLAVLALLSAYLMATGTWEESEGGAEMAEVAEG